MHTSASMLPTVTTQVKNIQIIWSIQKNAVSLHRLTAKRFDSLAQLVEHNTFNVGVLGSNPKRITDEERFSEKGISLHAFYPLTELK